MKSRFDNYGYFPLLNLRSLSSSLSRKQTLSFTQSGQRLVNKQLSNQNNIKLSEDMRLSIVKPTKTIRPEKEDVKILKNLKIIQQVSRYLRELTGVLAVDIETNGTEAHDPNVKIVGIGLANHEHILYIDMQSNHPSVNHYIYQWLREYEGGFVGHNILFDGCFFLRECKRWISFTYDTYGLFRQLANEGYTGFKYGLKPAQISLLGWEDQGDIELDQWLKENGHIKGNNKDKADKGKMWLAPPEILGYYCGMDAISTYQLLMEVFLPSVDNQVWTQTFLDYHKIYIQNVKILAEQQLSGITIDKTMLEEHYRRLVGSIQAAYDRFLTHPKVAEFREILKQEKISEIKLKEPAKFLKSKPDVTSKNWLKWEEKIRQAEKEEWFNPNSSQQLVRLFYQHLEMPIRIITESGQPSTGSKALPGLGELGHLLKEYKVLVKEQGYVEKCLTVLRPGVDGLYRVHPQFSAPGTLTCRLAGSGGLNVQQLPKSSGYLDCWRPTDPEMTWIDFDIASLEQVVLAELSRDESLLQLYGPDAPKGQDVYLFNGSQMPLIGPKILAAGYRPNNPDKETVSRVKGECKKERGIAKVITLGASYGAGPAKIQETLSLQGLNVSFEEARDLHRGYWDLYKGVKQYGYYLQDEWKRNNGYVLNGIGRPVCCAEEWLKDLMNRVIQSTGHDILMMVISEMDNLRKQTGVEWRPLIIDFHDESLIECRKEDVSKVISLVNQAYLKINLKLNGMMTIREEGGEVNSLAECKIEPKVLEQHRQEMMFLNHEGE